MLEIGGQLEKITTTKDGGWRVTFDFPGGSESGIVMAALATMRESALKLNIEETPKP